ncbi:hypothetical protein B2J96_09520 [Mycobacterium shigaense]|nr:hypothetical protein B2J96_09520 [Mycobacterium shigaense]
MSGSRRVQLDLTGLSCGACVRRVEKKLNSLEGVHASVDLSNRVATIDAHNDISTAALCDAVHKAGYGASPRDESITEADRSPVREKPSMLRTFRAFATLLARWIMRH